MMQLLTTKDGRYVLAGGKFVSIVPGLALLTSLTLNDFKSSHTLAYPVVQRKAGTYDSTNAGTADVPVLFSFAGASPANVQARVVNIDAPTTVIKDWTTLTNISANGSTGLGTLPGVPAGADYVLQIRDGSNTAVVSNGAQRWGVGVCVLAEGQSNMNGTLSAGSYTDIAPGTGTNEIVYYQSHTTGVFFGNQGFVAPDATSGTGQTSTGGEVNGSFGGTLSFVRIVAAALLSKYGKKIPVCLIPWSFGSTGIEFDMPGGAAYDGLFSGTGAKAGTVNFTSPKNYWAGDFEIVVWHQGENNDSDTRAAYLAKLQQLYRLYLAYVQPFGRTAQDLWFLPAMLGVYGNVPNVEMRRGAVLDLDAYARANGWPCVRAGWNCIDLDPAYANDGNVDSLHFQDVPSGPQFRRWSMKRLTQAVLYAVKCATFTGLGPRISATSVTNVNNVATLPVTLDGGTTLTLRNAGSAITGWSATNAGGAVAMTVAIASSNTVALTFPAGTVYPVSVQHCGGMEPDVTNLIVDNTSYPEGCTGIDLMTNGRPLLPTPDAIMVY